MIEIANIDWSTFNYWGAVINVFIILFFIWGVYVGIVSLVKGISSIKAIKYLISCMYVSILTPLVLIGLYVLLDNKNLDTGIIISCIFILGYIKHFYNDILEVIKIVILTVKKEIKKKRGNKN